MSRIPLTSGFTLIPEGEHVFRIYNVKEDEDFGKIEIDMVNAQGITHKERFSLRQQDGEFNEKALGAFSYFANTALNDYGRDDVEPLELVGHYIKGVIEHTVLPSNKDPKKTVTFANIREKYPADGFETTPVPRALTLGTDNPTPAPAPASSPAPAPAPAPAYKSIPQGLDFDTLLDM